MDTDLFNAARRYADSHVDANGVAKTPIPGLVILRETMPTPLQYAISKPLVALVLQGTKRVSIGKSTFNFGAGESLLITTDVPTVSQITKASLDQPYYSFVMELDAKVIAGLVMEMGSAPFSAGEPVRIDPTETEVADSALRLMLLLDRPGALSVLKDQLIRELHFWLLSGRHGGAIRALGVNDSHAQRIARAIALLRSNFAKPIRIEDLADAAGMSLSAFHAHFRTITSLSPLQFQKQLRLIEARQAMLASGSTISSAAFAVGYESVSQFTREYARMFGIPPARYIREAKSRMQSTG
ncbi:AraC family transcriptional regulator [Noviherbaspirillum sp. CPCC 100848]|uniref:AraC family transcriptional regulator n=1 Tax=Noviherbaspirillum album TaxID=3080276 RepID=A0ABU6JH03_9BURK|nr:AraC family transcriptional regulator [Noviherbaspirillum sp. CPCC 100848]MEC4722818.1 AraC family transcriptional regulator [Noviherbaspirillum sp. CPCC 100848]